MARPVRGRAVPAKRSTDDLTSPFRGSRPLGPVIARRDLLAHTERVDPRDRSLARSLSEESITGRLRRPDGEGAY